MSEVASMWAPPQEFVKPWKEAVVLSVSATMPAVEEVLPVQPLMQGWMAVRGQGAGLQWDRHWFTLRSDRLECCTRESESVDLQTTSRAVGFGAAAAALAESRGSPGDAAAQASNRPWGFVLDTGSGRSDRRFVYLDPGSSEALEAWVGAIGRAAGRLAGGDAWADVEACKIATDARSKAETFVRSGGVFLPSPRRCRGDGGSPLRCSSGTQLITRSPSSTMSSYSPNGALISPAVTMDVASPMLTSASCTGGAASPYYDAAVPSKPISVSNDLASQGNVLSGVSERSELQVLRDELAESRAIEKAQRQFVQAATESLLLESRAAGDFSAREAYLRSELDESEERRLNDVQCLREQLRHMEAQLSAQKQELKLTSRGNQLTEVPLRQDANAEALLEELESRQALLESNLRFHAQAAEGSELRMLAEEKLAEEAGKRADHLQRQYEFARSEHDAVLSSCSEALAEHLRHSPEGTHSKLEAAWRSRTLGSSTSTPRDVALLREALLLKHQEKSTADVPSHAMPGLSQAHSSTGPKEHHLEFTLTRLDLTQLSSMHKQSIRNAVKTAIEESVKVGADDVKVFLTRGSVRVHVSFQMQKADGVALPDSLPKLVAHGVCDHVRTLRGLENAVENGDMDAIRVSIPRQQILPLPPPLVGAWQVVFALTIRGLRREFHLRELASFRAHFASACGVDAIGGRVEIAAFAVGRDHVGSTRGALRGLSDERMAREVARVLEERWSVAAANSGLDASIMSVKAQPEATFADGSVLSQQDVNDLWRAFIASDRDNEGVVAESQFVDLVGNACEKLNMAAPEVDQIAAAFKEVSMTPSSLRVEVQKALRLDEVGSAGQAQMCCCRIINDKSTSFDVTETVRGFGFNPDWHQTLDLGPWELQSGLEFSLHDEGATQPLAVASLPPDQFYPNGYYGDLSLGGSLSKLTVVVHSLGVHVDFAGVASIFRRWKSGGSFEFTSPASTQAQSKASVATPTYDVSGSANLGLKVESQTVNSGVQGDDQKSALMTPEKSSKVGDSTADSSGQAAQEGVKEQRLNEMFHVGQSITFLEQSLLRRTAELTSDLLRAVSPVEPAVIIALSTPDEDPDGRRLKVQMGVTGQAGWISCCTRDGKWLIAGVPSKEASVSPSVDKTSSQAPVKVEITPPMSPPSSPPLSASSPNTSTPGKSRMKSMFGGLFRRKSRLENQPASPVMQGASPPASPSNALSIDFNALSPTESGGQSPSKTDVPAGWESKGHKYLGRKVVLQGTNANPGIRVGKVALYHPDVPVSFRILPEDDPAATLDLRPDEVEDLLAGANAVRWAPAAGDIIEGWKQDGSPLLGARVRRQFDGRPTDGTVVALLALGSGELDFRVLHDDGDEEDLSKQEVEQARELHQNEVGTPVSY
eukprot:TRINITY_DN27904_c0_g2_i1.p1 TRINITY_DN27904_c0_g2~~TRINITY_DN27904_c0_g2_i1.p1  ORF type:complete len:1390 (+),score=209.35 TRINITY_DN27904_c0_g2_i1:54-4223(+)